jgi:ribosomal protein S18 acetylase RimI-like enzyme
MSTIRFEPADAYDGAALTALWGRAYEGYFVPLQFSEAMLRRHVRRSQIDLAASLVGLLDDQPFGLSLAGRRGQRAWIGGFGVAAEHRRRGLAGRLIAEHVRRLDAAHVAETGLEVIDINPAQAVYAAAGFVTVRRLDSFEGAPRAGEPGRRLDAATLAAAHARLAGAPSWRREAPTVCDALTVERAEAIGVGDGDITAYAVLLHGEPLSLVDAAAADAGSARRLLAALGAHRPGRTLRLIDEPEGTPLAEALRETGFRRILGQFEMRRRAGAEGDRA